jgi:hypothetical protein
MADYVVSGLVKRRAELAGEADALKGRLAQIGADLGHLDATIRLFDPDFDLGAIRPKRVRAGDGAAHRGEMSRAVLGVLREASEPMTTAAVVATVMAGRGMDAQDREAVGLMMGRVGMALRRQERNGALRGERRPGQAVLWGIAT